MSGHTVRIAERVEDFFRHARWRACRMLWLTYQFEASAFERAFGRLLDRGVHGDIIVGEPVTHGSASYSIWRARWAMTFHPKMVVLLGGEKVAVGLGSSNLTDPGLRENLETWAFFSAPGDVSVLRGVRGFLENLGRRRVVPARILEEFVIALPEPTVSNPVISSLDGRLIQQVVRRVRGRVDRLDLVSPLHGDACSVVTELRRATSPREVHLYTAAEMLPEIGGVDGYYILRPPDDADESNEDNEPRRPRVHTVHAKIYAFRRGTKVDVFWGSANLSRSAWYSRNVELLVHSQVSATEWGGLLFKSLPEGHRWQAARPSPAAVLERNKPKREGWRLLHGQLERGRLTIEASADRRLRVLLRNRMTGRRAIPELHFKDGAAAVPHSQAQLLGFGGPSPPQELEWGAAGRRGIIPVNFVEVAECAAADSLANALFLRYAGRALPGRMPQGDLARRQPVDDIESSEEEELARSSHQGALDRLVLEWRSVARAIDAASGASDALRRWRLDDALRRLDADAKANPGRWRPHHLLFVKGMLKTWPD